MSFERDQSRIDQHQPTTADLEHGEAGRRNGTEGLVGGRGEMSSGLIQRKAERDDNGVAAGAEHAVSAASSSAGAALPTGLRRKFESSLGADLSSVRVHTGEASATAAHAVGARAYAVGQDVHFGAGHYDPSSTAGQHLIAHEVAHTVQQQGSSPSRQNKLDVSAPQDHAEHEADRAADAMVSGKAFSIGARATQINRDVFKVLPDPKGAPPSGQPDPFKAPGPNVLAPNVDKAGVAYEVPATDFTHQLRSEFPSVASEMPTATIADPGQIPGWKTVIPARIQQAGDFQLTIPAKDHLVSPLMHSSTVVQAWDQYKEHLTGVASTWNSDVRAKMNTYTQQKNGDPELQKMVDETSKNYNLASVKPGKGNFGQQAQDQQIKEGVTTKTAAAGVQQGGADLTAGAKQSAAQPENTTVAGAVKSVVDKLNIARQLTSGSVDKLSGTRDQLDAALTKLQLAKEKADQVRQENADKDKASPALEGLKAKAAKMNPTIGAIVAAIVKYREPLAKLKLAFGKGAKAVTNLDPKAGLAAIQALVAIANWHTLMKLGEELALFGESDPAFTAALAAGQMTKGLAQEAIGFTSELEAHIKAEKIAYEALAAELEKPGNWKGKNGADGKRAANALRAIPVADRVLRVLRGMKASLPPVPSASTRAAQGFTLATQGVGAPGAKDLLTVGSWIKGAPSTIDGEIQRWEGVRAQLEAVSAAMGIV